MSILCCSLVFFVIFDKKLRLWLFSLVCEKTCFVLHSFEFFQKSLFLPFLPTMIIVKGATILCWAICDGFIILLENYNLHRKAISHHQ